MELEHSENTGRPSLWNQTEDLQYELNCGDARVFCRGCGGLLLSPTVHSFPSSSSSSSFSSSFFLFFLFGQVLHSDLISVLLSRSKKFYICVIKHSPPTPSPPPLGISQTLSEQPVLRAPLSGSSHLHMQPCHWVLLLS